MQASTDNLVLVGPVSDEVLIEAIVNGEVWALEALYQRYKGLSYSLCFRMVEDHQIAQNLIQEAFVIIWRRAGLYVPQVGPVRSWLYTIVQRQTIDYLRALHRRSRLQEIRLETVDEEELPTRPDVWIELWQSILNAQVRRALLQIPSQQRVVIELAYFQGWTHSEIAQNCRLPLGTVKARIRLGLQHLKQTLTRMGVDAI